MDEDADHSNHADHSSAGDRAEDWDRRYTDGGHTLWSGEANGALVAGIAHLNPGAALDVGCGEGADAIWLAAQGWQVTAVDISAVAVDRAHELATTAGVSVQWVFADVSSEPLPTGPFDLVTVMYPAIRHTPNDDAIREILGAVAPGGTLLFVHHSFDGQHGHRPAGFDPADYVRPTDIEHHLRDEWTIEVNGERDRIRPAGSPGPDVPDIVLRARRTA